MNETMIDPIVTEETRYAAPSDTDPNGTVTLSEVATILGTTVMEGIAAYAVALRGKLSTPPTDESALPPLRQKSWRVIGTLPFEVMRHQYASAQSHKMEQQERILAEIFGQPLSPVTRFMYKYSHGICAMAFNSELVAHHGNQLQEYPADMVAPVLQIARESDGTIVLCWVEMGVPVDNDSDLAEPLTEAN